MALGPKKNTTEVTTVNPAALPAEYDYGEDSGGGMEGVDREEQRVPFLRVLQSNSPQVDESKGGNVIPGAKGGMLINMSTEDIYPGDGTLEFVSAYREKDYVEWVPVESGGGLVARHAWDDPMINKLRDEQGRFGKPKTPEGNEIAQTFYLYGILLPPGGTPVRVVIGFTSTQIKKYRAVIDKVESLMRINPETGKKVGPPLWAWRWRIKTTPEKNKKGSWFGIRLEPAGETIVESLLKRTDPLYAMAKEFGELLAEGEVTVDVSQMAMDAEASDADDAGAMAGAVEPGDLDDEIPYGR